MAARSNCGDNVRCWLGKSATGRAKCAFHSGQYSFSRNALAPSMVGLWPDAGASPNDLARLKSCVQCAKYFGEGPASAQSPTMEGANAGASPNDLARLKSCVQCALSL